jgi:hypothetical protein
MRYMSWSWIDYQTCPASVVARIIETANQKHEP